MGGGGRGIVFVVGLIVGRIVITATGRVARGVMWVIQTG